MKTAVGLFSGGLDSWLSALLIKKQGFKVYLLHFSSPYFVYSEKKLEQLKQTVKEYGMELIVYEPGQDYLDNVFCSPKYGYGSSKNACIDCHAYMLKVAKQKMDELKAEFVFSGEVLDQRPMSQKTKALGIIEKESGLSGYLIRPLSAKLLSPSIPEQKGILNRDMLMDISGRGRKGQMILAKELGLKAYPQPSGGCKFTDPNLTKRLSKMLEINGKISWNDLTLVKLSRNFYIGDNIYVFVTREEKELELLSKSFDMGIVIEAGDNVPSATGLAVKYGVNGHQKDFDLTKDIQNILGRIIARYTKAYQQGKENINVCFYKEGKVFLSDVFKPFPEEDLERYRL